MKKEAGSANCTSHVWRLGLFSVSLKKQMSRHAIYTIFFTQSEIFVPIDRLTTDSIQPMRFGAPQLLMVYLLSSSSLTPGITSSSHLLPPLAMSFLIAEELIDISLSLAWARWTFCTPHVDWRFDTYFLCIL